MDIDPKHLPQDPQALQRMVIGLVAQLAEQQRELRQVQHLLEQLLRWRYGQKRERVDENQLCLFAASVIRRLVRRRIRLRQKRPHRYRLRLRNLLASTKVMAANICLRPWSDAASSTILPSTSASARTARARYAPSAKRSASGWSMCPPPAM